MAARPEIISNLKQQAQCSDITLFIGDGRRAQKNVAKASEQYNKERTKLLEHELPAHYRLLISGSARIPSSDQEYIFAQELAKTLVERLGIDVITGAGPGIMGAAIAGVHQAMQEAKENGNSVNARNIGISIQTPWEEEVPDVDYFTKHEEMSTRLQELMDFSHASYFAPGGVGTELELLMALQLRQAKHLEDDYLIIVHPFWKHILDTSQKSIHDERAEDGKRPLAESKDFNVIYSEDIEEIVSLVSDSYQRWNKEIGQHVKRRRRPFWKRS